MRERVLEVTIPASKMSRTLAVVLALLIGTSKSAHCFQNSSPPPRDSEACLPPPSITGLTRTAAVAGTADEVLESSREALYVTERRYLRSDWCKSQPLKQTLREEGCVSRTVINRFCYGQCSSFYIPRLEPEDGGAFQSCSACRPRTLSTVSYTLFCPGQTPNTRHKRVQRVKQCRCGTTAD